MSNGSIVTIFVICMASIVALLAILAYGAINESSKDPLSYVEEDDDK